MLTFLHSTQTCSTAARIAMEEASIPYDFIEVSWSRNLNVEELAAVNPIGQVPTLKDGNKVITQTSAVLRYLADKAPEKKLLPAPGTWERTQADIWLSFISADFHKSFTLVAGAAHLIKDQEAQSALQANGREKIAQYLSHINSALEGKNYLLGDAYSLADTYLFIVIGWCKWAEVKTAAYPNIRPYLQRIEARPAVKKVLAAEGLSDFFPQ